MKRIYIEENFHNKMFNYTLKKLKVEGIMYMNSKCDILFDLLTPFDILRSSTTTFFNNRYL